MTPDEKYKEGIKEPCTMDRRGTREAGIPYGQLLSRFRQSAV